jgi:hypothetical protein
LALVQGCSFLNPLFYEEGFKRYVGRIVGYDAEKYTTFSFVKLEKVVDLHDGHRECFIATNYETNATEWQTETVTLQRCAIMPF